MASAVPDRECQAPAKPNSTGTACICPDQTIGEGASCVAPDCKPIACNPPAVPNRKGTACVCPKGTLAVGSRCVTPEIPKEIPREIIEVPRLELPKGLFEPRK